MYMVMAGNELDNSGGKIHVLSQIGLWTSFLKIVCVMHFRSWVTTYLHLGNADVEFSLSCFVIKIWQSFRNKRNAMFKNAVTVWESKVVSSKLKEQYVFPLSTCNIVFVYQ